MIRFIYQLFIMFNNHKIGKYYSAIALSLIFLSFSNISLNAQENTSEYPFLEDIEAGTDLDWSFSSEDESASVRDDIKQLEEYSISESDELESDFQLIEEEPKWGNRGDVEDYSIEAEIYDYWFQNAAS